MTAGDFLCVLGGAEMPFVIRKNEGHHNLVGACFVDDIMDREAVECMKAGTTHRDLLDPDRPLSRLYNIDAFPTEMREKLNQMKRESLEMTSKEYEVLKEEFTELGRSVIAWAVKDNQGHNERANCGGNPKTCYTITDTHRNWLQDRPTKKKHDFSLAPSWLGRHLSKRRSWPHMNSRLLLYCNLEPFPFPLPRIQDHRLIGSVNL